MLKVNDQQELTLGPNHALFMGHRSVDMSLGMWGRRVYRRDGERDEGRRRRELLQPHRHDEVRSVVPVGGA